MKRPDDYAEDMTEPDEDFVPLERDPFKEPAIVGAVLQAVIDTFTGWQQTDRQHSFVAPSMPLRPSTRMESAEIVEHYCKYRGGEWVVLYLCDAITLGDLRRKFRMDREEMLEYVEQLNRMVACWARKGVWKVDFIDPNAERWPTEE